jgi:hypothetical protein
MSRVAQNNTGHILKAGARKAMVEQPRKGRSRVQIPPRDAYDLSAAYSPGEPYPTVLSALLEWVRGWFK